MTKTFFVASALTACLAYSYVVAPRVSFAQDSSLVEFQDEETGIEEFEFEEEEEDELASDRDSFTRSPTLMRPCQTMVEVSHTFLDQDAENEGHLYPDLLVRRGVNEWLEVRLGWTYESSKFEHLAPVGAPTVQEGIINYGAKLCLTDECGSVPASALIVTGYSPTSGESNDSDFSIEYVFGWKRCDWELDGQLRWFTLTEEDDHFTEWAPSVVLKRGLCCGRANAHIEYFSLHSVNRDEEYHQHYAGPGAHFLVTPNFEIGARVFWGLSGDAAEFISNVGFAARY